jgi:hypothetical protein
VADVRDGESGDDVEPHPSVEVPIGGDVLPGGDLELALKGPPLSFLAAAPLAHPPRLDLEQIRQEIIFQEELTVGLRARAAMSWGVFKFYLRTDRGKAGWEITCPFHKHSEVTGCKKYFQIDPLQRYDLEAHIECIRRAKWWGSQAFGFTRKREHGAFHPDYSAVPVSALLEHLKIDELLEDEVMTDGQLDLIESGGHEFDDPAVGPGAGRGRGSGVDRGRARGRARGRGDGRIGGSGGHCEGGTLSSSAVAAPAEIASEVDDGSESSSSSSSRSSSTSSSDTDSAYDSDAMSE